ncbi:MAG: hypothetical protein IJ679_01465 [Lachnospiraceae bacterium]|nr:hypothetical protein [Lachnospiraceae bacterium]
MVAANDLLSLAICLQEAIEMARSILLCRQYNSYSVGMQELFSEKFRLQKSAAKKE